MTKRRPPPPFGRAPAACATCAACACCGAVGVLGEAEAEASVQVGIGAARPAARVEPIPPPNVLTSGRETSLESDCVERGAKSSLVD